MSAEKKRKCAVVLLGGGMYALLAGFGWQTEHADEVHIARALGLAAALLLPAMGLLFLALRRSERVAARYRMDGERFCASRAFAVILACYVPMLAVLFPGSFAYDVPFQLEQVFTGAYSTHHPLLHTLLLGACVKLGRWLGNINMGAALYSVIQMTALAACFAATCASIARQSGVRAAKWSAAFFAIYPMHMMMAVNATKDVLFSGLFALTLALLCEDMTAVRDTRRELGIVLCGAGMLLLRNNALYAAAVWLLVVLVLFRRRAMRTAGVFLLAIVFCVGAGRGMQAITGAQSGDLCEMLSLPIQQLARARNLHGARLTEEEHTAIDELMPGESWALYDPTISDPVKFEFDTQTFLSDPARYVEIYVSVGKKCPQAYLDAALKQTYSFWYPYARYAVSGYYLQMGITDEYYEWCDFERITDQSLLPRLRASLNWRFGAQGAMQIPGIGWLFNMGVIVWVMLYFVLREMYLGRWACFACALLPVLLWGTFLLGPVMAGRYIYPFVCCLPVLAAGQRMTKGE